MHGSNSENGDGEGDLGWLLRQEVDDVSLTKVFLPAAAAKTPLLAYRENDFKDPQVLGGPGMLTVLWWKSALLILCVGCEPHSTWGASL